VPQQSSQCVQRIWVVHQYEASNHGIEGLLELQLCGVSLQEAHIGQCSRLGAICGSCNGLEGSINAYHSPAGTHHVRDEESDIPAAAANIENSHASANPGLLEELPRERLKNFCLRAKTIQFPVRVSEHVWYLLHYFGIHSCSM
jgi:hypothetical protein